MRSRSVLDAYKRRLELSCRTGDLVAVRRLLDCEPSLAKGTGVSVSPLMWSAYFGHLGVVRVLLERGADPNHLDSKGGSALHAVCAAGHQDVFDLLISAGARHDQTTSHGTTALIIAARSGFLPLVKALLELDEALLDMVDLDGYSAVMWASYRGQTAVLKYLLNQGADISRESVTGRTALCIARQKKNGQCIQLLLAAQSLREREAKRCQVLRHARQLCDDIHGLSTLPIERLQDLATPATSLLTAASCFGGLMGKGRDAKGRFQEGGVGMPVVEVGSRSGSVAVEVAREYVPWMEKRPARVLRARVAEEVIHQLNPDVFAELLAMMEPRRAAPVVVEPTAPRRRRTAGKQRVFRSDLMAFMDQ